MYLRANMVSVDHSRLDDLTEYVREQVLPAVQQGGTRGLAMGVDRDSGMCSIVTFWEDLDLLHASESRVAEMRDEARDRFGATFEVVVAEVLARHVREQPRPGCWNRITMLDMAPADVDGALEAFHASTLPALDALDGFCAATLSADRERGRAAAVTTWRDRDALHASADRATTLREEVRDKTHGQITAVVEEEIVLMAMEG